MSRIIVGLFLVFSASVILRTLALPTFSANDDGTVSVFVDPDEYGKTKCLLNYFCFK